MKRPVVSLGLIGAFLLITNLIFAQDIPSASSNTDTGTVSSDTQANTDAGSMPTDNTEANTDAGSMPADTQANTDAGTVSSDTQANTDAGSMPADTQANTDNAASGYGSNQ